MDRKKIIELALGTVPPGCAPDAAAGIIENFLRVAETLAGSNPPSHIGQVQAQSVKQGSLIVIPTANQMPSTLAEEPPARLVRNSPNKGDVNYRTTEEIMDSLRANTPDKLKVDLGDGKPPLMLVRDLRRIDFTTGEGGGMVKLRYHSQGEDEAPTVSFSTGDPTMNIAEKMAEIEGAAKRMYSREPRRVEARRPPPVSLGMGQGFGGDADEARVDERQSKAFYERPLTAEERLYRN